MPVLPRTVIHRQRFHKLGANRAGTLSARRRLDAVANAACDGLLVDRDATVPVNVGIHRIRHGLGDGTREDSRLARYVAPLARAVYPLPLVLKLCPLVRLYIAAF